MRIDISSSFTKCKIKTNSVVLLAGNDNNRVSIQIKISFIKKN